MWDCLYYRIGNPTRYRNIANITWSGRQLTSFNGTTFTYDGRGRRISKGGITFTYDSEGNLIKQSNGLSFFYDCQGVAGFDYNNTIYYYRKDAQGNIIAILDSSGTAVVKYYYDAWGNHIVSGSNTTLGNLNPFRYRGYYFDTETKLYFLQTRYYDPEVGRFISQDSTDYADPSTVNGLNLYAYCGNNPVMNVDPTGCMPNWAKWLIGAAVIGGLALATVLTAGIAGVGIGAAFSAGFAGTAIGAGVSGFAVTVAAGAFAGAVVGGISTGTWQGLLDGAAHGFMAGAITGAITGGIRSGINFARTTPLIRSVSGEEFNSIKSTGSFSSNGSMESKWFATNKSDSTSWARWFNQSKYVGIRVPTASLINNSSVYFVSMLDGIGAAYCIDVEFLNTIIKGLWFF